MWEDHAIVTSMVFCFVEKMFSLETHFSLLINGDNKILNYAPQFYWNVEKFILNNLHSVI